MSELACHILELEIAPTREDPRRVAPVLSGPYESVLDIGCGAGQTMINSNAKNLAHQLHVIVNGLFFPFTGRLFRSPFNRAKCESFQTARGSLRAMRAAGFDQVRAERDRFLVVTASKQG